MTTREQVRQAVHIARRELDDAMRARREVAPAPYTAGGFSTDALARLRAAEMAVDATEAAARRYRVRV